MMDLNMSYESVLERTFPQIGALLESSVVGGNDEEDNEPEEEHSVMDGQAFAALFAGFN